jgi:acetylglutamate kinase
VAPLSHDGQGQLLNTNADTIAQEIAQAMCQAFQVELIFAFEKSGVLLDINDPDSRIEVLDHERYMALKLQGVITDGMIPKQCLFCFEKGSSEIHCWTG